MAFEVGGLVRTGSSPQSLSLKGKNCHRAWQWEMRPWGCLRYSSLILQMRNPSPERRPAAFLRSPAGLRRQRGWCPTGPSPAWLTGQVFLPQHLPPTPHGLHLGAFCSPEGDAPGFPADCWEGSGSVGRGYPGAEALTVAVLQLLERGGLVRPHRR